MYSGLKLHSDLQRAWRFVVLLSFCLILYLPGLGALPPMDRDESLFAEASKQMVESNNFVDIRFQDRARYQKPIGIYWLQSAAVKLIEPVATNEIWVYRLPSAIGMTIAVLMTAAVGTVLFSANAGFFAGIMLMVAVICNVEARLATTDAALLGAITTVQFALARSYRGARGLGNAALFWTALAIGFLLKGPIVILPLLGTLAFLLWHEKRFGWLSNLRPLPGFIWFLCAVTPWFVAISLASKGAFLQQSAGHDLFEKIWHGQNRGRLPPGLHLLFLPYLLFPCSLFAYMALPDVWRNRRDGAVVFCLGWIIPAWVVFEASLTKLAHYTMPTYPALAVLAGWALSNGYPAFTRAGWRKFIYGCWIAIGIAFAIIFCVLDFRFHGSLFQWTSWLQIFAGVLLVASQILAILLLQRKRQAASLFSAALGGAVFVSVVLSATMPNLGNFWLTPRIYQTAAQMTACAQPDIVAYGFQEPSLVFMGGTQTTIAVKMEDVADMLLQKPCSIGVIETTSLSALKTLLQSRSGTENLPLVVDDTIKGFNLGNGHWYEIEMVKLNKPR